MKKIGRIEFVRYIIRGKNSIKVSDLDEEVLKILINYMNSCVQYITYETNMFSFITNIIKFLYKFEIVLQYDFLTSTYKCVEILSIYNYDVFREGEEYEELYKTFFVLCDLFKVDRDKFLASEIKSGLKRKLDSTFHELAKEALKSVISGKRELQLYFKRDNKTIFCYSANADFRHLLSKASVGENSMQLCETLAISSLFFNATHFNYLFYNNSNCYDNNQYKESIECLLFSVLRALDLELHISGAEGVLKKIQFKKT